MFRRPLLVFRLFMRASRVQKKRATLTIAAIAWSSLSLLLLLSFGEGLKRQLLVADSGLGRGIAILWPGETTRPWNGMPSGRSIRPRVEDIELISQRVANLHAVSGEMRSWDSAYRYGNHTVNRRLTGASLSYGEIRNHIPRSGGRFLNPLDEKRRRRVIFLGDELAAELFGNEEPVGSSIFVDDVPYTVVGVSIDKLQNNAYGGEDAYHGVIPISTFEAQYGDDQLENIVVKPLRADRMPAVLKGVYETLGAKYRFDPEDERALAIWNTVEDAVLMDKIMLGIQLFLGVIGALTLVVGGVGVANIMYAVVKERTSEIGVKMALGARPGWITGPLILEGLTYTSIGGALGLIMATVLIAILDWIPTDGNEALQMLGKPTLSVPIVVFSAAVLGSIGSLAGYFPARRAALVDPAETLRHE